MEDEKKRQYGQDIFDLIEGGKRADGESAKPLTEEEISTENRLISGRTDETLSSRPEEKSPENDGAERTPLPVNGTVLELNIDDVFPDPDQPRKAFDRDSLAELAESIRRHGVIMPIVVSRVGNRYVIIAGERRYRASRLAGRRTVPAVVKNYDEREIREVSLIENLQREDLNPIEAANAMKKLMEEFSLTQEDLADRIGKSRSTVANTLRLLTLPPAVIELVGSGKLSAGHARALVSLPRTHQERLARRAVSEGLSVRDVEKAAKEILSPKTEKRKKKPPEFSVELKDMIYRMQRIFGTRVTAVGNDNKGRIYVDYYTRDDLDRICELLDRLERKNSGNA